MISSQSFQLDPQKRLVLREGGGCLSVFGLPFFGAGVFMLLVALGLVPLKNAKDIQGFEHLIFLFMGLIFGGVGATLVFGRKWLTIDLTRGIITEAYGLLTPMKQKTASLRDFQVVAVRFDEGDSDTADRYPLLLEDQSGQNKFILMSSTNFGKARDMALQIADYLSFPFEDRTSASVTVYDPKTQKTERPAPVAETGTLQPLPPQPRTMKSVIENRQGVLEIFIPAPAFFNFLVVLIVIVFIAVFSDFLPAFGALFTNGFKAPHNIVELVIPAFVILIFLSALLRNMPLFRKNKKFGALITVTNEALTLEEKNPGKSLTRTFPVSDIIAVDVMRFSAGGKRREQHTVKQGDGYNPFDPSAGSQSSISLGKKTDFVSRLTSSMNRLVLKTNREVIPFGYGLTREEATYLSALINRRLRGI